MKQLLANPNVYHFLRQAMTLGIPFGEFIREFRMDDPSTRIVDIGCGPVDLLRYLRPGHCPAFYLGVDQSELYLARARERAHSVGMPAQFEAMDLTQLTTSPQLRAKLSGLIGDHACNQSMLLGVLHHIPDVDAISTLRLLHDAPTVQRVFTWDVAINDGRRINNFLAKHDRGQFVRREPHYARVIGESGWTIGRTFWTHPGLSAVDYLHYELVRA